MQKFKIFALGGNLNFPVHIDREKGEIVNPDMRELWNQAWKNYEKLTGFIATYQENQYLLTQSNRPRVRNTLLRSDYASKLIHKQPLDFCGADTQVALG